MKKMNNSSGLSQMQDTKQKLLSKLILNNEKLAPQTEINSLIMENVLNNYVKDKKSTQLNHVVNKLEGKHRKRQQSLTIAKEQQDLMNTTQKTQQSFVSDLESHLTNNQEQKQKKMKEKNEKSYNSLCSVEEYGRQTQSQGIVRLNENHWGAIAKLNLYNKEKQQKQELGKIKDDKKYIKKELGIQIKERREHNKEVKKMEKEDEQQENQRTIIKEEEDSNALIDLQLKKRRILKNNLDQQMSQKAKREKEVLDQETRYARASLQKNIQDIHQEEQKQADYFQKKTDFFADRNYQLTSLQQHKRDEILRSRQEQNKFTNQWEAIQEEKEAINNKKTATYDQQFQQHQTWVSEQKNDIRQRQSQVGKVIDKWEANNRKDIVQRAHRGELRYKGKKADQQNKWNIDIVEQMKEQKQYKKLNKMMSIQEARAQDMIELNSHLEAERQAREMIKNKNNFNSVELNKQIKARTVHDETIKDMNKEEILYNQRYLIQIKQLQNKTDSSFNKMFNRKSLLTSQEDFFLK